MKMLRTDQFQFGKKKDRFIYTFTPLGGIHINEHFIDFNILLSSAETAKEKDNLHSIIK